ncbi:MAG: MCE family protein [Jatrophihabitans sp.]
MLPKSMLEKLTQHWLRIVAGLIAVLVVVAGLGLVFRANIEGPPTKTIVAEFVETPGLYTDNAVNILGVKTGKVTTVRSGADLVRVTMEIPQSTKLPADVRAILMAPNPVSDRAIELYPPYTSGPQFSDGAPIPLSRTAVPLSVDAVFGAVDDLAKTLGPSGANKGGALSRVVKSVATLTKGNGKNLQNTLAALASALPAFTADPHQISRLIDNLDTLGKTLAEHNSTIDSLFSDVAVATKELADERGTLAAAIGNLQDGMQRVAAFIRANRDSLKGSVANLATTTQALIGDQKALTTTFGTAALGFQNFNRAVDENAPCAAPTEGTGICPIVYGRLDFTANTETIIKTYCHSSLQEAVPILLRTVPGLDTALGVLNLPGLTPATTVNTLCVGEYAAVQGRGGTPGAPPSPDLGLSRFLK